MDENLIQEKSEFAYNLVKTICTEIGPGCPGSQQEFKRAIFLKNELEKFMDSVEVEEFECAPKAFLGWFKIGVVLASFALIFFYLSYFNIIPLIFSSIGFAISIFIFLMMYFEFITYHEFIDFLYKKKKSLNIIGKIYPKNEVNHIIIFSGHHDSALQFNWLKYLKKGYYITEFILIFSVCLITVALGTTLIYTILQIPYSKFIDFNAILIIILYPFGFIIGWFFVEKGENGGKVPGATDNLLSSAISITIAKILKEHPELIPEKTEIRIISFGSEEAGTRGSFNYVNKHFKELKEKNAICINYESICHPRMTIYTSDENSFLRNSKELVKAVEKSAINAKIPYKIAPFPLGGGGTDALPFSRAKIRATCIYAMKVPSQMIAFYHQPEDNYDKLDMESIQNAIKLGIQFVQDYKSHPF